MFQEKGSQTPLVFCEDYAPFGSGLMTAHQQIWADYTTRFRDPCLKQEFATSMQARNWTCAIAKTDTGEISTGKTTGEKSFPTKFCA